MLDKERAIAMPVGLSDVVNTDISCFRIEMYERVDSQTVAAYVKRHGHAENLAHKGKYASTRTKKMKGKAPKQGSGTLNVPKVEANEHTSTLSKTGRRHEHTYGNVNGMVKKLKARSTKVIIDQFVTQSEESLRNNEASRKSGKMGSRSILKLLDKGGNSKKSITKSCLRQLNTIVENPEMRRRSTSVVCYKKFAKDKAGNNNWMLDNDEISDIDTTLVVPTFHTKSRASSFSSFIQPNCSSKTIFRTSSSDDSSCFSSVNAQNSKSLRKRDSRAELHASQQTYSMGDSEPVQVRSRLCSICRNQSLGHGWHLCKNCSAQVRQEVGYSGPLNELKAYAQSIANSVKKILLLSPGSEQDDQLHENSAPRKNKKESVQELMETEGSAMKSGHEGTLHRYMTEINMASFQEPRSKSMLNKSVSYDGQGGGCFDEKDRRSPLYWLSQDKIKVSNSFSKLTNSRNLSNLDDDYGSRGRQGKNFIIQDGERNQKICRTDKSKQKMTFKQLTRVERARTDGDIRASPLQQSGSNKKIVKDENKKGLEFQRNRSKTFHEVDADIDELCEYSSKQLERTSSGDDINFSRQKVIYEGSPVDPPCNLDNKKMEDYKGRKTVFFRSATAPYRNHFPKKDTANGEKLGSMEGVVKPNKSSTKATVRTNKASTLRKENSLSDRRKVQEFLEPQSKRQMDDASAISAMSFTRRRSTSYDGRKPMHPRRDDPHRSISWSMVEGDDEGSKQRRAAASVSNISAKRQKERDGKFSVNPMSASRFRERWQKEHQVKTISSTDPFLREPSSDNFKYQARETSCLKSPLEIPKDVITPHDDDLVELTEPQNVSHLNNMSFYGHDVQNRLYPCIEEDVAEDQSEAISEMESYYSYAKTATNRNQPAARKHDSGPQSSIPFYKTGDNEAVYHDQITSYADSDALNTKSSSWYTPLHEGQMTMASGERSLVSKSSTSFHLVTNTKSSHSDETLMKYSEAWDHATVRKQSMYTETDVDTGLIYHLAKRQTTRTHVPPYHDLTSSSRDIYTMSGDVVTSISSNSPTYAKKEVSESAYTGGFYKEDPFYSTCNNSDESSSLIYFETDGQSKRVPSEMDIYTGSIFNSSQNIFSLAQDEEFHNANTGDGYNSNSARSLLGKTQRHLRYRPRNDPIASRNDVSEWEHMPQPVSVGRGFQSYDASNNSNNWSGAFGEYESSVNQGSIVTKSTEPLYTDYDPGMRPEFNVKTIEKTGPVFNFLKYESSGEPAHSGFLASHPVDNCSGDNNWYSGLLRSPSNECLEKRKGRPDESPDDSLFSWQYSDDYYTSTMRPRVGKVSKYAVGAQGKITQDTNNNYFEELYTGSYGVQDTPPRVQEQPAPVRQPSTENWYLSQPSPRLTSTTFYNQKYDSAYASNDYDRRSTSNIPEPQKDTRATSSNFAQDTSPYCGSSPYVTDNILRKYDQIHNPPLATVEETPPRQSRVVERQAREETESYFNHTSNKSMFRGFYTVDDDTYSFEPKVVKTAPEVPVVREIRTVGGIVCRENVANKEDYAEDINRDLEAGPWSTFSFRSAHDARYPMESSSSGSDIGQVQTLKQMEDTSYAHNRIYDNIGARNKWREMATRKETEVVRPKDTSHHRAHQGGDTGKDHGKYRTVPDIIPDRARGRRANSTLTKTTVSDSASKSSNSHKKK